ncbi:MAG: hypothetical protein JSS04_17200 [Proteobacteria bacterium]|nr:hypothetical protein [Pseudomonadota bacterium]
MRNKGVAVLGMAVLAGSLIASSAGAQTQLAQTQLASAMPAPERDVLVFTERGGQLSPTATSAVRGVAAEARSSRVRLVGRPENLAAVKSALEKAGVPAKAISVERDASAGLPRPGDGVNQPADRRVEIKW